MPKVEIIATKTAQFAPEGARRYMRRHEARVLVAIGQATYAVPQEERPRKSKYRRRDVRTRQMVKKDTI